VHCWQRTHLNQLRQLERVLAIAFFLHRFPPPTLVIAVGHLHWNLQSLRQVAHPSRRRTHFDHQLIRHAPRQQLLHLRSIGADLAEAPFTVAGPVIHKNTLVLSQIQSENPHGRVLSQKSDV
jgi:hypothetical protein